MKTNRIIVLGLMGLSSLNPQVSTLFAQSTTFTYQGRLNDGASPANGSYDLRFDLRDAPTNGSPVSTANTLAPIAVSNGLFTVTLDFGASAFDGSARWLEVGVRTNGSGAAYSILSPRQALRATPYAISATTAGTASNVVNGSVVKSLNTLKDNVTLAAGTNVTISPGGNTLTISSAGAGGSGIWSLNGGNTYYNVGNVGIGTTTPANKLTVLTPTLGYGVEHTDGDARLSTFVGRGSGWLGTLSNHKLTFFANDNGFPNMTATLDTTGNFGIGTDTPANKLTVFKSGYGFEHNNGAVRLGTYVDSTAGWLGTISNDKLNFFVNGGQASMTVDTSGNVGIGTTTPVAKLEVAGNTRIDGRIGVNTPVGIFATMVLRTGPGDNYPLLVRDFAGGPIVEVFGGAGTPQFTTFGAFTVFGHAYKSEGGTSWETASDRRLKQDVRAYEAGLNEVLRLRPVRFRYRDDVKKGLNSAQEEVGFIAQEVREVIPDAVTEGKDGYLMLKADPIHWAAINAIQGLNAKLEKKDAKIAALEKRLEALEKFLPKPE